MSYRLRSKTQASFYNTSLRNIPRITFLPSNTSNQIMKTDLDLVDQQNKAKNNKKFLRVFTARIKNSKTNLKVNNENLNDYKLRNLKQYLQKNVGNECVTQRKNYNGIQTPIQKLTNIFKDLNDQCEELDQKQDRKQKVTEISLNKLNNKVNMNKQKNRPAKLNIISRTHRNRTLHTENKKTLNYYL